MNESERMRTAVHEYCLREHRTCITTVLAAADFVVEPANGISITTGPGDPLRERLTRANVIERLPTILAGASKLLDTPLAAEPVAAPPYVVVTNVGPIMRATLHDRRLVITIEAFRVDRNTHRYVRTTNSPAEALTVEIHEHP